MKSIHLFLRRPPKPDHFTVIRSRIDNLEQGIKSARLLKRTISHLLETVASLEGRLDSLEAGSKQGER